MNFIYLLIRGFYHSIWSIEGQSKYSAQVCFLRHLCFQNNSSKIYTNANISFNEINQQLAFNLQSILNDKLLQKN